MRLAWHLNERSGLCCIATLSDALGVDEKTVKRSIKALEDVDLLIVERRNGAHNHYALPFLKIKGLARQ